MEIFAVVSYMGAQIKKESKKEKKMEMGRGQKTGLPRAPKGAELLCILRTKSTLHYRFITSAVI